MTSYTSSNSLYIYVKTNASNSQLFLQFKREYISYIIIDRETKKLRNRSFYFILF